MARRRKWTPKATILPKYTAESGWRGTISRHPEYCRPAPISDATIEALWLTMGAASDRWREDMTNAEAKDFNARWRRTERELGLRK